MIHVLPNVFTVNISDEFACNIKKENVTMLIILNILSFQTGISNNNICASVKCYIV